MRSIKTRIRLIGGTFARGVHPADSKQLSGQARIEILPTPPQLLLPVIQHLGSPAEPVVKPKEQVSQGQLVAKPASFVSAGVHSPVSGIAGMLTVTTLPNGRHMKAVPVAAEGDQPLAGQALWDDVYGGDWPTGNLQQYAPGRIVQSVRDAGIVGMGGAAFPTHVKLARNEKRPIQTLLINGCECEPYLTADYWLMLQGPCAIVSGALLAQRACGAERVIIAIEDNKPSAIDSMRTAARGTGIDIAVVRTKYPQGGERQLTIAVLGKEVPTGGLPLDVGAVVLNVATSAAVARAVIRGKPLTHRIITISGAGIKNPKNLLVPIGASYSDLIAYAGGLTDDAVRVISGGPMMGFAISDLGTPITKGTSGITVLTEQDVRQAGETPCVRCGRCVDVCPLGLVPTKMALAARHKDWELARRYQLQACCECGCCGYICPARIPLVQLIRMGKVQMTRE